MSDIDIMTAKDGGFDLKGQIAALLKSQAFAARDDLVGAAEKVAGYAEEQALQLVGLVGDPGFMLAVEAAAENVLMRAGVRLVAVADASDARFIGTLQAALAIGAKALARGLIA